MYTARFTHTRFTALRWWRALIVVLAMEGLSTTAMAVLDPTSETTRLSVDAVGVEGNNVSEAPALSGNGRFVAFASWASNLVPGDGNGAFDVFVRDRVLGTITRVSVSSAGVEGNGPSRFPAISDDGRFVAFESDATNLVPGDANSVWDIFVHDRQTGTTTRVSFNAASGPNSGGGFAAPLSGDGRFVAFHSAANTLVPGDTNNESDIFVSDRQTGVITRVSVDSAGAQSNNDSYFPAISADGRFVTFYSTATNLVPGDTNNMEDVFVHDRQTGATTRVSVDSAGIQGNSNSRSPALSGTGRFITFQSVATNLVPGDGHNDWDIFVHDRQTGATTRVSVDSAGLEVNGQSYNAAISGEGRFVVFRSYANSLVPGDTNAAPDIFVHDRTRGATTRLSVASGGVQSNGGVGSGSDAPAISAYMRIVAFQSVKTNLVPGDTNAMSDVFVYKPGVCVRVFTSPMSGLRAMTS